MRTIIAFLRGWRRIEVLELQPGVPFKERLGHLEATLLEPLRPYRTFDGRSVMTAPYEYHPFRGAKPQQVLVGELGLELNPKGKVWARRK